MVAPRWPSKRLKIRRLKARLTASKRATRSAGDPPRGAQKPGSYSTLSQRSLLFWNADERDSIAVLERKSEFDNMVFTSSALLRHFEQSEKSCPQTKIP